MIVPRFRVHRTRIVHRGRVFDLAIQDVTLPNGRRTRYDVIRHPGAVAIVPILPNGDLLLVRQFRVATQSWLVELPAGTREKGEPPRATALREVIEETGHRARRLVRAGAFYTVPGFCTERILVYAAFDLEPCPGECDPDEVIRPVRLSWSKAARWIDQGKIHDAKSIAGLILVRRMLEKKRTTKPKPKPRPRPKAKAKAKPKPKPRPKRRLRTP